MARKAFSIPLLSAAALLLIPLLSLTPRPALSAAQEVKVRVRQANIRSGPGFKESVVTKVKKGQFLSVIKKKGDWYHVRITVTEKKKKSGWGLLTQGVGRGGSEKTTTVEGWISTKVVEAPVLAGLSREEYGATAGVRLLDEIEEKDIEQMKKGGQKVDYAAIDAMDKVKLPSSRDYRKFAKDGKLKPERQP